MIDPNIPLVYTTEAAAEETKSRNIILQLKPAMTLVFLFVFCFSVFGQRTARPRVVVDHQELGNTAFDEYRFEEAVTHFEAFLKTPNLNDSVKNLVNEKLAKARIGQRLMRGVEDIVFIDSIQISKADLLRAFPLDAQNGSLFQSGFLTERGILKYFSNKNNNGDLDLFRSVKLGGEWAEATPLSLRINTSANEIFPFVTADGITLYFASDGAESLGGYDIFMSRFQPSSNDFLQPENIGMPFNSPYNDYLLVIDEIQGIGWFASDRFQPADTVVVYSFIPNIFRRIVNAENTEELRKKASLRNINLQPEKRPVPRVITQTPATQAIPEFEFWVNDRKAYHFLSDFRSDAARRFFVQAREEENKTEEMRSQLEVLRANFEKANSANKALIVSRIIEFERELEQQKNRPLDFYRQAQEVENRNLMSR